MNDISNFIKKAKENFLINEIKKICKNLDKDKTNPFNNFLMVDENSCLGGCPKQLSYKRKGVLPSNIDVYTLEVLKEMEFQATNNTEILLQEFKKEEIKTKLFNDIIILNNVIYKYIILKRQKSLSDSNLKMFLLPTAIRLMNNFNKNNVVFIAKNFYSKDEVSIEFENNDNVLFINNENFELNVKNLTEHLKKSDDMEDTLLKKIHSSEEICKDCLWYNFCKMDIL